MPLGDSALLLSNSTQATSASFQLPASYLFESIIPSLRYASFTFPLLASGQPVSMSLAHTLYQQTLGHAHSCMQHMW